MQRLTIDRKKIEDDLREGHDVTIKIIDDISDDDLYDLDYDLYNDYNAVPGKSEIIGGYEVHIYGWACFPADIFEEALEEGGGEDGYRDRIRTTDAYFVEPWVERVTLDNGEEVDIYYKAD